MGLKKIPAIKLLTQIEVLIAAYKAKSEFHQEAFPAKIMQTLSEDLIKKDITISEPLLEVIKAAVVQLEEYDKATGTEILAALEKLNVNAT